MGPSSRDGARSRRSGRRRSAPARGPGPVLGLLPVRCAVPGTAALLLWTGAVAACVVVGTGLMWVALNPLLGRSSPVVDQQDPPSSPGDGAPAATSRLVVRATVPTLVDTASGSALEAGTVRSVELPQDVPVSAVGVLLAVSVHGAQHQGAVRLSGWGRASTHLDARPVLQLAGSGAAVSQLVTLPLSKGDRTVRVTLESGGHLSVRLVGVFAPASLAGQGRVLAVPPQRLLRLSTVAGTGRTRSSGTVRVADHPVLPRTAAGAVLLQVVARAGPDGAQVALGAPGGGDRQVLRWGLAGTGDGDLHQAMALVPLTGDGGLAVELRSGRSADVEMVGYVTGQDAAWSTAGLVMLVDTGLVTASVEGDSTQSVDVSGVLPASGAAVQGALVAVSAAGRPPGEVAVFPPGSPQPASPVAGIEPDTSWSGEALLPVEGARVWVSGDRDAEVSLDVLWALVGSVPG